MSKEKQIIDEMAGVIYNDSQLNCEIVEAVKISEALYNAGYRKQSENMVEVVRCKDCREWQRNVGFVDSPNGHCFCHDIDTNGHDFCSYGEMKGGAE